MPIDGHETMGSRGGNLTSLSRKYIVDVGPDGDEEDVLEWVADEENVPGTLHGLVGTGVELEEHGELENTYNVTVQYGQSTGSAPVPETDSVEYRFNFQAQGGHFTRSFETIASYAPSGETAPDFKGAIGVVHDAGKDVCQGIQVEPPPETFTVVYYPANATVSSAYQNTLSALCGCVNSDTFRGFAPGEIMLVRCSGGVRTNEDWSIEYGFAYIPNDTYIPVGDEIEVDEKEGHDLLWVYYRDKKDPASNLIVPNAKAAFVERVWRRAALSGLALP